MHQAPTDVSVKGDPETVLVTYHVKPGQESQMQAVLGRAWDVYRREHLVLAEPHIVASDKEEGSKPRFVELFTWVSHSAPEKAPASVQAIWSEEQSLCEARNGKTAIEGGEVQLLVPGAR